MIVSDLGDFLKDMNDLYTILEKQKVNEGANYDTWKLLRTQNVLFPFLKCHIIQRTNAHLVTNL